MINSILCFVLLLFLQDSCGKTEVKNINQTNRAAENIQPTPTQEKKKVDDKENLAERVEKIDADSAGIIREANSNLEPRFKIFADATDCYLYRGR